MKISSVSVWGDSIGKCVVFDEARGRYAICKDNYASHLKAGGVTVENHSVMGYTVCQAQLAEKDMRPGGVAAIEFGGNDCDLDWKAVLSETVPPKLLELNIRAFEAGLAQ